MVVEEEESVSIVEVFLIVCIFPKEDLMMIGAKVITVESRIVFRQNKISTILRPFHMLIYWQCKILTVL